MVISKDQALSLIAVAQQAVNNGGEIPTGLRCQYPSKRCDHVRTTKRGGGLHRLCTYHRDRANKNQWLVDQRRRARRDGTLANASSAHSSDKAVPSPTKANPTSSASADNGTTRSTLEDMDMEEICAPLDDADFEILRALLIDSDEDDLSKSSNSSETDATDTSVDGAL